MKFKHSYLITFILLAIIQLTIPARMIWKNNDILNNGILYKFKNEPVDPYDAFKGKYIYLNFKNSLLIIRKKINFNKTVYAILKNDEKGFATITHLSNNIPNSANYLKVKASVSDFSIYGKYYQVWITFPFDKFYMNEFKAPQAEENYSQSTKDQKQSVYALVSIKNGEGVVKYVYINNVSISKFKP